MLYSWEELWNALYFDRIRTRYLIEEYIISMYTTSSECTQVVYYCLGTEQNSGDSSNTMNAMLFIKQSGKNSILLRSNT